MENLTKNQKSILPNYASKTITSYSNLAALPISGSKDFTLIEALIILALFGIIRYFAVPNAFNIGSIQIMFPLKGCTPGGYGCLAISSVTTISYI